MLRLSPHFCRRRVRACGSEEDGTSYKLAPQSAALDRRSPPAPDPRPIL